MSSRQDPEELLEQAIVRLEEDPAFDLDEFLHDHIEVEDELRLRLEKLLRHGLLLRHPRARRVLERLRRRYSESEDEEVLGGRYQMHDEIGRGGSNRVYRAFDRDLERDVAIKVVEPDGELASTASIDRLLAEARVTGQLEHPGIVPVHDLGVMRDGRLYFAMKLIEGRTLHHLIAKLNEGESTTCADFPLARLIEIVERIAEALAYAHDRGVVHRDLKPANVMVGPFGEVQVVDWGLARLLDGKQAGEPRQTRPPCIGMDDWAATRTGDVYGTPSYMAPEQAAGRVDEVDEYTDVFGVGALLYHLLSGNAPYWGATAEEVIERARQGRLNDPRFECAMRPVPRELKAVCLRALAPMREMRYASVQVLAKDLRAYTEGCPGEAWKDPVSQRVVKWVRRKPVHAVLAVTALLVASGARIALDKAAESAHLAAQRNDDALRDELVRLMRWIDVGDINSSGTARAIVSAFHEHGYPLDGPAPPKEVAQKLLRLPRWEDDHLLWAIAALHEVEYHLFHVGWAQGTLLLENADLGSIITTYPSVAEPRTESDRELSRIWTRLGSVLDKVDRDPWRQDVRRRIQNYGTKRVDGFVAVLGDKALGERSGLDLSWLGRWVRTLRGTEEAGTILKLAASNSPSAFRVQAQLALIAYNAGEYPEAVRRGSMAYAIDPRIPSASNNLCAFLRMAGGYDEAIEVGRKAAELAPNNASAFNNLGLALVDRGQLEDAPPGLLQEAVEVLEQAVHLDSNYANGWANLAQARLAIEDFHGAVQATERSVEEAPNTINYRLARAFAHEQLNGPKHAAEIATDDCWDFPGDPRLWFAAGQRLFEIGQIDRGYAYAREGARLVQSGAIQQLQPAVDQTPAVRRAALDLALALSQTDPDAAGDWFRVALISELRHEYGRSAEAYSMLLESASGLSEDLHSLCAEAGVASWQLFASAARSASMAAAGNGFAFVRGVAWMEEHDPPLVDMNDVPMATDRRATADRPPLRESPEFTREWRDELLARSVEWLGLSLEMHWQDMQSESPELSPEQHHELVSAWLGGPEFAQTLAGSDHARWDGLAEDVAIFLEHATELAAD